MELCDNFNLAESSTNSILVMRAYSNSHNKANIMAHFNEVTASASSHNYSCEAKKKRSEEDIKRWQYDLSLHKVMCSSTHYSCRYARLVVSLSGAVIMFDVLWHWYTYIYSHGQCIQSTDSKPNKALNLITLTRTLVVFGNPLPSSFLGGVNSRRSVPVVILSTPSLSVCLVWPSLSSPQDHRGFFRRERFRFLTCTFSSIVEKV